MNPHPERTVLVEGVELGRGSRVRLRPSGRTADVLDLALTGRTGEVDAVEEDMEGQIHLVVTLEGDDGRDFRTGLGHRFFFTPEEVEPVEGPSGVRLLIAGIGNIFLADDAFGPEVVTAMRERPLPEGVHIADFGIRGMDLAYRLQDGYDVAVLVDAAPRGGPPGSLYVIEPEQQPDGQVRGTLPEAHGMDPVQVLSLARHLGGERLPRVLVLGCEPSVRMRGDEPDVVFGLSGPVKAAVGRAVEMLESLTGELLRDPRCDLSSPAGSTTPAGVRQ